MGTSLLFEKGMMEFILLVERCVHGSPKENRAQACLSKKLRGGSS